MQKIPTTRHLILPILFVVILITTGCSSAPSNSPAPSAIEAYLQALVAKNLNQMIGYSCAEWEEQARLELQSFAAEKVLMEDLDCQASGEVDDFTLVSCNGRIIASYGAEDLVLELNERIFMAKQESGDWRMCGYQ